MWKILGVVVLCYAGYALHAGEVFARSGVWGRVFPRDSAPVGYWAAVGCYALLGVAMLTLF